MPKSRIKIEFEKWASKDLYDITPCADIEDMYEDISTQRAWVVWQSAFDFYRKKWASVEDANLPYSRERMRDHDMGQ